MNWRMFYGVLIIVLMVGAFGFGLFVRVAQDYKAAVSR